MSGMAIRGFRGLGTPTDIFVMGRVFQRPGWRFRPSNRFIRALVTVARRALSRGIGGATVQASLAGAESMAETDNDGYFALRLRLDRPLAQGGDWHEVGLRVAGADGPATVAHVFVPPPHARFAVVSDIDDTVVETGVSNKLVMMWRLFAAGVESRMAFPGVAAFYRALHRGRPDGGEAERNPMVYVSRGPWSIYDILERFFRLHRIPVGPVLFLREWGMTLQRPLPPPAREHKIELIRRMLEIFRDLPFVLIGDSGQRDPEIYARIVKEHPHRVKAVYIRRVGRPDPMRRREIQALAAETAKAGVPMLLADHSTDMARHAAELGLIEEAAIGEVGDIDRRESQAAA